MKKLEVFCPEFTPPEQVLGNYFRKFDTSVGIIESVRSYGGEPVFSREGLYNCDQYMF